MEKVNNEQQVRLTPYKSQKQTRSNKIIDWVEYEVCGMAYDTITHHKVMVGVIIREK